MLLRDMLSQLSAGSAFDSSLRRTKLTVMHPSKISINTPECLQIIDQLSGRRPSESISITWIYFNFGRLTCKFKSLFTLASVIFRGT